MGSFGGEEGCRKLKLFENFQAGFGDPIRCSERHEWKVSVEDCALYEALYYELNYIEFYLSSYRHGAAGS